MAVHKWRALFGKKFCIGHPIFLTDPSPLNADLIYEWSFTYKNELQNTNFMQKFLHLWMYNLKFLFCNKCLIQELKSIQKYWIFFIGDVENLHWRYSNLKIVNFRASLLLTQMDQLIMPRVLGDTFTNSQKRLNWTGWFFPLWITCRLLINIIQKEVGSVSSLFKFVSNPLRFHRMLF